MTVKDDKRTQSLLSAQRRTLEMITPLRVGPQVGSCGTAAFLRQAVIVSDIATDPLFDLADYRDRLESRTPCCLVPAAYFER